MRESSQRSADLRLHFGPRKNEGIAELRRASLLRLWLEFRDDEDLAGIDEVRVMDLRLVGLVDERVARRVAVIVLTERP